MSTNKRVFKKVETCHIRPDDAGNEEEVIPKLEFVLRSVDPGEAEAYWAALCEDVEFHIPQQGKKADDPPVGYFTCYEAHIVRCRLRFPIPEIIVRTLNRFGLSIGQINLTALQHLLGILVLSYEHGVPLSVDHFEALLKLLSVTGGIYRLAPCAHMSIIRKTILNGHAWEKYFFFIRVNSASVEEGCIPVFRSEYGRYETNPLPLFPDDVIVVRDLLPTSSFFWTSFTPKRVWKALKHYQS
ncbi:hypothetical protein N665_0532s0010 [Sinapis alba]|nr:hypothetical protein N665_0532s0010 [Sinapis alba]